MNKVYRTVWSELTRSFVAVAEIVRSRGKGPGGGSVVDAGTAPATARAGAARRLVRGGVRPLALEPRLMFDGAAVAAGMDAAQAQHDAAQVLAEAAARAAVLQAPAPVLVRAGDPALNEGRREVAFVDTAVEGYRALEAGIRAGVEIVEIDGRADGLAQMARWAQTHSAYEAVHILSHGEAGTLHLGAATLTAASLGSDVARAELAMIGRALSADGDLLLYGCDIGKGAQGQSLMAALQAATGADVAASTDLTGAATQGGDWVLEASAGTMEAQKLEALNFAGLLDADTTRPQVVSITRLTTNINSYTNADELQWLVTFSEPVKNVTANDFAFKIGGEPTS